MFFAWYSYKSYCSKSRLQEPGAKMKSIILADDQEYSHLILHSLIENKKMGVAHYTDCQLFSAYTGKECLKILEKNPVDLIFLDIEMPVMNGYETLDMIQKNPSWKQIPTIALTAQARDSDRANALRLGFYDHIPKPYDLKQMVKRIIEVLQWNFKDMDTSKNSL